MIDLHCHLLPGVDDGASGLEETFEMCRIAAQDGCTAIVATPHLRHQRWWNDQPDEISRIFEEVKTAVQAERGIQLDLFLGGEIAVNSESIHEIDILPKGTLFSLAGSRYVLLEFDPRGYGPDPIEVVFEVSVRGLFPIVAHPERIPWLARDPQLLEEMVAQGGLSQITAMSLTGQFGRRIRKVCHYLLESSLVHFVASDAHGIRFRKPGLRAAREIIANSWGVSTATALFRSNPQAVIKNQALSKPTPKTVVDEVQQ